jgi:dihydroneopterin aldolase
MPRADHIELKGVRLQTPCATPSGRVRADVRLRLDLMEAARHERIESTVDYRKVHDRLREAARRCRRGLAGALARAVLEGFPQVEEVEITGVGRRPLRRARMRGRGSRR